jgi:hypothetical protein
MGFVVGFVTARAHATSRGLMQSCLFSMCLFFNRLTLLFFIDKNKNIKTKLANY